MFTLYLVLKMSVDDTDESLEVEHILDDLKNSEDGCSDDCSKSIVDEDFPSYKTVVLDSKGHNTSTGIKCDNTYSLFHVFV